MAKIHYGVKPDISKYAPEGIDELTRLARLVKPTAVVWRLLQGVRLLGANWVP